jgi:septum site-determining protein MinC
MPSHLDSTTETFLSFQLKGGLYPLTALQLLENNLAVFEQQLESKIQQAPKFFQHAPVVIDLQKLKSGNTLDFNKLKDILLKKQLIPVGIKSASLEQQSAAILAGLAIFQEGNKEAKAEKTPIKTQQSIASSPEKEEQESEIRGSNSKVITEPVRSGQQIYARGGDLIVIAPVSQGAELLADGHIHVYGPLRGRALAGVTGDQNAHIFCQSLEAELISIAGQYKISEDIDPAIWRLTVDISMEGGHLHIQPF